MNNTQNEPLAANEKIAGKWLMDGSPNYGKGYMAGDQKDLETVKKFMDAYENMDAQLMVEMSVDTVRFHPADLGGVFKIDMTNTNFIKERQSNWDSITRDYIYLMPLKIEGSKNRVVTTMFTETRFIKNNTQESINFYERLYLNENSKIVRVVQYSRPTN
jgi:hypothetical protein